MKSKLVLVALTVALTCGLMMGLVCAQGNETTSVEAPITTAEAPITFGWIIAAWLIYSFVGFFASGETFNGVKFARTFIITIVAAFIAIALKVPPGNVTTQYGPVLDQIATVVLNTGPGITLIYLLEKLWKIVSKIKTKIEKAKEIASAPGPPTPTA